jgi:GLPGLI family protein
MKKILNVMIMTCILAGAANLANAQGTKISEGKVIYDITYPGTELDQNTLAMMPSESTLYFKKEQSRMEMKTGMGNMTTISNAKDESAVTLMDMMGNKMAIKMTKEDMKKEQAKAGNDAKPDVKITGETKDIAGYKCTKAIVTSAGKDKKSYNAWFTKDIEGANTSRQKIEGIDGFLMEFQYEQQGMTMKMSVRSVEKQAVDDAMFKIPDGYKEMTMDDMKKMGAGGR